MVIGAVYCPKNKVREITNNILDLKNKYGIGKYCELKWTKVSKSKEEFFNPPNLFETIFKKAVVFFKKAVVFLKISVVLKISTLFLKNTTLILELPFTFMMPFPIFTPCFGTETYQHNYELLNNKDYGT